MQHGWKAVWSIPYVSVAYFSSLKQNFMAYRSTKMAFFWGILSKFKTEFYCISFF